LEVFKCPVAVWSMINEDISPHNIMAVRYFWQQINQPHSNIRDVGKAIQHNFPFCAAMGFKGEGKLWLNFKYFIQSVKSWWPTQKLLWSLNFHHSPVAPYKTLRGPLWGGIRPTLRTTSLNKRHVFRKLNGPVTQNFNNLHQLTLLLLFVLQYSWYYSWQECEN
jgi:hypothetical protein